MPFHVEEDVGLGLYHSLLVGQSYSTVIEMEPTAFMSCICGVMSRANAVSREEAGKERTIRRRQTTSFSDAFSIRAKRLPGTRGRRKLTALHNSW